MSHLSTGAVIEGYRIERELGSGGFGVTYLVKDEKLGKLFALKEYFPVGIAEREERSTVRPKASGSDDYAWGMRRFLEEAQHLARFEHPNIVGVVRVFDANNTAYIVLEFQAGRNLSEWLREFQGPPTQTELDMVLRPIFDALSKVHANGLLHRDLAPDNIYIRDDGSPVLLDFGSARQAVAQHTGALSSLVKGGYSPPELYSTKGVNQGPWTDIYALGATLYRAVAGTAPNPATDRLLGDELIPLLKVARGAYRPGFLAAIDWALNLNPRYRPQSIEEWSRALFDVSPNQAPSPRSVEALSQDVEAHVAELARERVLSRGFGHATSKKKTGRKVAAIAAICLAIFVVAPLVLPAGRQLLVDGVFGGQGQLSGVAKWTLCSLALDSAKSDWSENPAVQWGVTIARRRGFDVNDCRQALGYGADLTSLSKETLCRRAVDYAQVNWDSRPQFADDVTEAHRRNLTVLDCQLAIAAELPAQSASATPAPEPTPTAESSEAAATTDVCRMALDLTKTHWDANASYASAVAEASRRELSVEQCRLALGLPAAPSAPPAVEPSEAGVTFDFTNNSGSRVDVAFFDKNTKAQRWPEQGRIFILGPSEHRSYPFTCTAGESYCYGAWVEGDFLTPYWGTGRVGKEGCANCCLTCSSGSQWAYTLNQSDWRRPPPTFTWKINNYTGRQLVAAFYSSTRPGWVWPDANRVYNLSIGQNSMTVTCQQGEAICYGIWDNSNVSGPFWGVGPGNHNGCTNCCNICNGGELDLNLTDGD